MITIECDARLVRAAMQCQGRRDYRYYINGVFFGKNGDIVATNGHVMFVTTLDNGGDVAPAEDSIIFFSGLIPASATRIKIQINPDGYGVAICEGRKRSEKIIGSKLIHGRYPDYLSVYPKGDAVAVDKLSLQTKYLKIPSNIFTFCTFELRGDNQAYVIRPGGGEPWPEDTKLLIMPART